MEQSPVSQKHKGWEKNKENAVLAILVEPFIWSYI